MTREQGLEVIEQLFRDEVEDANQGARFYYISPEGDIVHFLNLSSTTSFQPLLTFLESRQGKAVIRREIAFHITFQEYCSKIQLVWKQVCCNPKYDPVHALPGFKPEGWGNLVYLQRTMDFEDDLASFDNKPPEEKQLFVSYIVELIQDTKQIISENQNLLSQALRSLIDENDFSGKPWTDSPKESISPLLAAIAGLKQEIAVIANQSTDCVNKHMDDTASKLMSREDYLKLKEEMDDPLRKMLRIGLESTAFFKHEKLPDKYVIKGPIQTAFFRWFKALEEHGYLKDNFPITAQIEDVFTHDNKKYDSHDAEQKSIKTAYEIALRNY